MSASDQQRKTQRQLELEEKRRKLQQFKDQNNRVKQLDAVSATAAGAANANNNGTSDTSSSSSIDVNELLAQIAQVAPTVATPVVTKAPVEQATPQRRALPTFVDSALQRSDIGPVLRETYSKGTQTDHSFVSALATQSAAQASDALTDAATAARQQQQQQAQQAQQTQTSSSPATTSTTPTPAQADFQWRVDDAVGATTRRSSAFAEFCARAVPVVERAIHLGQRFDYLGKFGTSSTADGVTASTSDARTVTERGKLYDERWCRQRAVSALDWSLAAPELIAVAMSAPEQAAANTPADELAVSGKATGSGGASRDVDGVVCVWSASNLLGRPEFVFTCASRVTAIAFANYQPTLLVGGTYSGQIVLWDTRAGAAPVQRALVSSLAHTHPVFSVSLVGTSHAHNLVTVSTDGRMCVWAINDLTEPLERLELVAPANVAAPAAASNAIADGSAQSGDTADAQAVSAPSTPVKLSYGAAPAIAATVVRFPANDVNSFYCGSDEGVVWHGMRHGTYSGVREHFDAHAGPVTGLDYHPPRDAASTGAAAGAGSVVFLSSSADWSVKLWHARHPQRMPIASFDFADDYVSDVKWSPVHPALFAAVDVGGALTIWNICTSIEEPAVRMIVAAPHALVRVGWRADGKCIAVGDSSGRTILFDVPAELAVAPANAWEAFDSAVAALLRSGVAAANASESLAPPPSSAQT